MKVPSNILNALLKSLNILRTMILSLLKRIMRLDQENRLLMHKNRELTDNIILAKANELQAKNDLNQARIDAWGNTIIQKNNELKAANDELIGVLDHIIDKQEKLVKENDHMKHYLSKRHKLSDKDITKIVKTGDVKDRNRSI